VKHFVHQADHVGHTIQMPDRGVNVDRFDRIPHDAVNDVEELRKLQEIAIVRLVSGATSALSVDSIRCTCDTGEGNMVAAKGQIVRWISGMNRKLVRRFSDEHFNHSPVHANPV
jgi:hypothetical protein